MCGSGEGRDWVRSGNGLAFAGAGAASYTCNGAGKRISKTVNGTTTNYTWDPTGLGTVIADGMVENVFGPAGLAEQVDDQSQTSQFAGADALGSIRLITDGSGTVVGTGSDSPWGTPHSGEMSPRSGTRHGTGLR